MYIAWDHNTSEEIHNYSDGVIHWGYWIMVGISWFVPTSIMFSLLGLLIAGGVQLWARLKKKQRAK
jgi:hypothetical protein